MLSDPTKRLSYTLTLLTDNLTPTAAGTSFLLKTRRERLGEELRGLFERYLELARDGSEKTDSYRFIYALVRSPM